MRHTGTDPLGGSVLGRRTCDIWVKRIVKNFFPPSRHLDESFSYHKAGLCLLFLVISSRKFCILHPRVWVWLAMLVHSRSWTKVGFFFSFDPGGYLWNTFQRSCFNLESNKFLRREKYKNINVFLIAFISNQCLLFLSKMQTKCGFCQEDSFPFWQVPLRVNASAS